MEVLVFKTSVQSADHVLQLAPLLNQLAGNSWNFALDDCDRILRIATPVEAVEAIRMLKTSGFDCEELV